MELFLNRDQFIRTDHFHDLSIPLSNTSDNPRAWYVDPPVFEPVRANGFIGSVREGGSVNFRNIFFNPHGHGTHTECLGHITEEVYSVNKVISSFLCTALVVSVQPAEEVSPVDGKKDLVIYPELLRTAMNGKTADALIIRTLPNDPSKKSRNYSAQNPAYLDLSCIEVVDQAQVRHLLIDMPSVDREEDGGVLAFHHAFWKISEGGDFKRTITELIYVPQEVEDGLYILDLQVAPFENDAAPCRPLLYPILGK